MPLPTRPVVPGFHPDPSICRVGNAYFLACSSFEYAPGVPLFRSVDLVHWELIGHALERPSQLDLATATASGGIYAPTLRHHGGRFWLVTSNVDAKPGHLLVTAEDPAGPWSEPVFIRGADGIDPDLTWDDTGACLLTWSGVDDDGRQAILQGRLDPDTGELLTTPRAIWWGTGGKYPEAPHLYRRDGGWYLLIAEGGTERAHTAVIARGLSPAGPFTAAPTPLLTARGLDTALQNTGHADLVERPDGSWAVVFLGVRVRGMTPSWHVLGRETFAAEIGWTGAGWPVVGAPIEPSSPVVGAEELGPVLPATWAAPGCFPDELMTDEEGSWTLRPGTTQRSFVGRRQQHLRIGVRADLAVDDGTAGLEIRVDHRHAVAVETDGRTVRAVARLGGLDVELGEATAPDVELVLRVEDVPCDDRPPVEVGPDEIVAGYRDAGGFHELGRLDGRYLSTEVTGGFTGRFVGITARGGPVAVRSFTYRGSDLETFETS